MRKPIILAVDDTPANLVALEAVLEGDFDVVQARSGQEAIARVEDTEGLAVILMDVQMPGMDGFEAAARIKRLPNAQDVPIIFITAVFTEDPYIKRGYAVGGVDYFTKPFDPDLLRLKLRLYASFQQRAAILREREIQLHETEELIEAGRKLATLLEDLPVGVLVADVDGRICQANDEVSRICGSAELIRNDRYGELLGWWDSSGQLLKDHDGPPSRALRGEPCHHQAVELRCIDGKNKPVLISASPLLGLDGQVVGAVIVIQDVSEPRRIGAELEERITRLVSLGVELEQTIRH